MVEFVYNSSTVSSGLQQRFLPLLLAAAVSALTCSRPAPIDPIVQAQRLKESRGRTVFNEHCLTCHTLDGTAPQTIAVPPPNDLRTAGYKFRSTPTGKLPTDADILRVLRQGVLGTTMPSYPWMPEEDMETLLSFLKSVAPAWRDPAFAGTEIDFPDPPRGMMASKPQFLLWGLAGRELFATSCTGCHGYGGKGDGPIATTLTDNWDRPIRPADLTRPYVKRGYDIRDLYRAPATGLNGTPMPSFAEAYGPEQVWGLAAFAIYLRYEALGKIPVNTLPPLTPPEPDTDILEPHPDRYVPGDEMRLERLLTEPDIEPAPKP